MEISRKKSGLKWVRGFLPSYHEIFLVFGLVLFIVHTWAFRQFLYKVPSFILHMNIGQIAAIFAYMMAFAFIESIIVTGVIVFACIFIPPMGDRLSFTSKAFLMVSVAGFAFVDFMNSLTNTYAGAGFLLHKFLIAVGIFFALLVITYFFQPLQKVFVFLAEQVSVMIYIYLPVGLFSLLAVIFRNLF